MLIHVTRDHIANGRPNACQLCAVALALYEATGERWQVHADVIQRWAGPVRVTVPTPAAVEQFVDRFDKGAKVAPFSFEFNPPVEAIAC